MKTKQKLMLVSLGILATFFLIASCGGHGGEDSNKEAAVKGCGNVTDPDGNTYKTVEIGNHCWMAENLRYNIGTNWCYDNNPENCKVYGRLYDGKTAKNACPVGWHLATEEEWKDLLKVTGIGSRLASKENWNYDPSGRTNEIGFNAVAAGNRQENGSFSSLGEWTGFWYSSDDDDGSYLDAYFIAGENYTIGHSYYKTNERGHSIRCVKD